jgi:hypothetical protein
MRTSPFRLWLGLVVTAVLLTGCSTAGTPEAAPTASPTATPTPSATPSETPAPAEPVVCETLVDDETEAKYAAAGWVLIPEFRERALESPWEIHDFFTYGGVLCQWGMPGTDAADLYGYSPLTPEQAEIQKARLTAEGLMASTALGGIVFERQGDPDQLEYDQYYLFLADSWYFSSLDLDTLEDARRNVEAGTVTS